jgi:hypothetical protein
MPIRCRFERNTHGFELSRIPSMADAVRLSKLFEERGIGSIVTEPAGPHDYRLFIAAVSRELVQRLVANADIELIY